MENLCNKKHEVKRDREWIGQKERQTGRQKRRHNDKPEAEGDGLREREK